MENGTKKEKIQGIIIAILSVIIVLGGAFFASELKYCEVKEEPKVTLEEIGMNEFTTLLNDKSPSIVYIARPSCGFCQQQEPIVESLVASYELPLFYLNTDNLTDKEMLSLFKVDEKLFGKEGKEFGTPTTIAVKGGKIIDALVGLTQKADFEQFLKNNGFIK